MEGTHGSPIPISPESARVLRLRAQGLLARREGTFPGEIVATLVAVQAQDPAAAALSLWARGITSQKHLERAILERRVIRTWAMRGTLHLIAAPDVRWIGALLAPILTRPSARHAALGLDPDTFARATPILIQALRDGRQRTRAELGAALGAQGISPEGQRLPHLLGQAALRGVICQGPLRGTEPTYVLLDEWLPAEQPLDRTEALARLAWTLAF